MNEPEIQLHDKTFVPYIHREEISQAIKKLANRINEDFEGQEVILLGILDGAFMVLSDLVKNLSVNCYIDFVKFKSYVGQQSTGKGKQLLGASLDLKDKNVIIVEDIIDTGHTLTELRAVLAGFQPKSLGVLTLLIKEEVFKNKFPVNYSGISIDNKFVVGYGMDYDGLGRHIPDIYVLKDPS